MHSLDVFLSQFGTSLLSSSNCCFLTCTQFCQEAGQVVWYSHLLQNFPQFVVIHTVKGFGVVNKAEIDSFLELSWFISDPMEVGNLFCGSSAFSKTAWTSGSSRFMYCWSLAWRIFTNVWDKRNCAVVWAFFGIAFGSLSILWHCLSLRLEWKLTFSSPVAVIARCPNPRAGREKASKTMQLAKKGKFIADLSQGSRRASNAVVRDQRALRPSCYPIYKVCISSW